MSTLPLGASVSDADDDLGEISSVETQGFDYFRIRKLTNLSCRDYSQPTKFVARVRWTDEESRGEPRGNGGKSAVGTPHFPRRDDCVRPPPGPPR